MRKGWGTVLPSADDESRMTRYLLGELPDEERARVEERFFADDQFFESLCALEEELIRDYLRGQLPPPQHTRFEQQLEALPELRRKVETARALMAVVARQVRPAARREPRSFWTLLKQLFLPAGIWRFASVAAAVMVVTGAIWLGAQNERLRSQLRDLRGEREALRQALATRPPLLSFVLSPGGVRGGSEKPVRLLVPRGTERIRVQLDLAGAGKYKTYRAVLRSVDGGAVVWSGDLSPSTAAAGEAALYAEIPAAGLGSDDYVLSLAGLPANGSPEPLESYSFGVLRK